MHLLDVLRSEPELSPDGGAGLGEAYERVIKLSVRLLPGNIALLNGFLDDPARYAVEAHGIKGVLNSIGAYKLGEIARRLEECSRCGDLSARGPLHDEFCVRLLAFTDRAAVIINSIEPADKPEGDPACIARVLPMLRAAAERFDSALALEILSSVDRCTYGQPTDRTLEKLARAFERFDFDRAAALLETLKGDR
ncbi:MAG: Hpt domain-containing protein [Oscillospiraceae bacterium]|nr:Hpt domain-containing protein [Oscillospiraceae bacterium]